MFAWVKTQGVWTDFTESQGVLRAGATAASGRDRWLAAADWTLERVWVSDSLSGLRPCDYTRALAEGRTLAQLDTGRLTRDPWAPWLGKQSLRASCPVHLSAPARH